MLLRKHRLLTSFVRRPAYHGPCATRFHPSPFPSLAPPLPPAFPDHIPALPAAARDLKEDTEATTLAPAGSLCVQWICGASTSASGGGIPANHLPSNGSRARNPGGPGEEGESEGLHPWCVAMILVGPVGTGSEGAPGLPTSEEKLVLVRVKATKVARIRRSASQIKVRPVVALPVAGSRVGGQDGLSS